MPERTQYQCPRCERTFPQLQILFMHLERTTDEAHQITERYLLVDRSGGRLTLKVLGARAVPAELKEQEVTA